MDGYKQDVGTQINVVRELQDDCSSLVVRNVRSRPLGNTTNTNTIYSYTSMA